MRLISWTLRSGSEQKETEQVRRKETGVKRQRGRDRQERQREEKDMRDRGEETDRRDGGEETETRDKGGEV
jgi:hypothetical protein